MYPIAHFSMQYLSWWSNINSFVLDLWMGLCSSRVRYMCVVHLQVKNVLKHIFFGLSTNSVVDFWNSFVVGSGRVISSLRSLSHLSMEISWFVMNPPMDLFSFSRYSWVSSIKNHFVTCYRFASSCERFLLVFSSHKKWICYRQYVEHHWF